MPSISSPQQPLPDINPDEDPLVLLEKFNQNIGPHINRLINKIDEKKDRFHEKYKERLMEKRKTG